MSKLINELLEEADQRETKKDKIEFLGMLKFNHPEIISLLKLNFREEFDPLSMVEFSMEPGTPKNYKPDYNTPEGLSISNMAQLHKKLYVLGEMVKSERKEELFLVMLESLHPKESEILILAKDGNLKYRYPWLTEKAWQKIKEYSR